ncbi:unnamed protein product [Thlaspi arvense]|uniref:Peptidase C1A papain C-terminal domain-containing protein n=1 Tax=Thlaspi arvense TaxID=13288 RepID=A0AAU9SJP8_THLAR|nr:unnamed protein product [Thlaspi arvense]
MRTICWAIALVRAMQALLNINVSQANQMKELSIQHVVNSVPYEKDGIHNMKKALAFAKNKGTCSSSQCPSKSFDGNVAESSVCRHPIHTETIDDFVYISDVNDNELMALVAQQPVIGILRNPGRDFMDLRSDQIYRSPAGLKDISFHQWIIQNSHGESWADGGFGYMHRRTTEGGSEFYGVAYPQKRAFREEKMELDQSMT